MNNIKKEYGCYMTEKFRILQDSIARPFSHESGMLSWSYVNLDIYAILKKPLRTHDLQT